jgi:hypothetical protein
LNSKGQLCWAIATFAIAALVAFVAPTEARSRSGKGWGYIFIEMKSMFGDFVAR